jgi:hypothetical protein
LGLQVLLKWDRTIKQLRTEFCTNELPGLSCIALILASREKRPRRVIVLAKRKVACIVNTYVVLDPSVEGRSLSDQLSESLRRTTAISSRIVAELGHTAIFTLAWDLWRFGRECDELFVVYEEVVQQRITAPWVQQVEPLTRLLSNIDLLRKRLQNAGLGPNVIRKRVLRWLSLKAERLRNYGIIFAS